MQRRKPLFTNKYPDYQPGEGCGGGGTRMEPHDLAGVVSQVVFPLGGWKMNQWPPAEGLVALCGHNREATPGLSGRRGLFFAASPGARVGALGVNPKRWERCEALKGCAAPRATFGGIFARGRGSGRIFGGGRRVLCDGFFAGGESGCWGFRGSAALGTSGSFKELLSSAEVRWYQLGTRGRLRLRAHRRAGSSSHGDAG